MSISFIITTYNVAAYIGECLDSLASCVRPGDQVILVDDGSTDDIADRIEDFFAAGGFGPDVLWTPIWLGTNTFGGVGIAANIGLDHALRDTIFFVDGDDYLIPEAFKRARRDYEAAPSDICIANYEEFDQRERKIKKPADWKKWSRLEASNLGEARRIAALDMIAVPWRKFYNHAFLKRNDIRYPEGDFFFEDNPFHWRVCLAARTIECSNHIVCHHRVNRPGQTMASTGRELAAFFTHFETIRANIPAGMPDYERQALRWLIGNISWHIVRLQPGAFNGYVTAAAKTLQNLDSRIWTDAGLQDLHGTNAWRYAEQIRRGNGWDVIEALRGERTNQNLDEINRRLNVLERRLNDLDRQSKAIRETVQAKKAIDEFQSIKRILYNK